MRFLEKLLLLLFTLCLAAVGVGGIWACYDVNLLRYVNWAATLMTQNRWITLIVSACLLLLAILLLFGVVFHSSGSGRRKDAVAQNVIMVGDPADNVQISTKAVDCIIQKQKTDFAAINELETKISQGADGVQVLLKVAAAAEANIPELASALQAAVKKQLEDMVGLKVSSVKIVISDVTPTVTENPMGTGTTL